MLYDKNDDYNPYGVIKKEKLNIKKVILFVVVVLICFLIIFGSFYISYNKINKNQENMALDTNQTNQENVKETPKKKVKGAKYYEGTHTQIAMHEAEVIEEKYVPVANPNAQSLIKDIYKSDEKQVYLTFDDGPSKTITPQILNILREQDVKATFFVLGARVELYPDILKQVYEEGHYIANHGYSHEYSRIYESKDTTFQEYVQCENSIKTALGNPDYNTFLFRFPGGSSGGHYASIKAEARELFSSYNVAYTNWNCLTGDAAGKKTKEDCIQEFLSTKGNQNSLIVLMHDAGDKQYTADALPDIIQYLKNEGYTFKTFADIFKADENAS